jgi:hypothetical protein
MATVSCRIEEGHIEINGVNRGEGILATCEKCGHQTTSVGTSEKSRKRCLWLMSQECPQGESNFYEEE